MTKRYAKGTGDRSYAAYVRRLSSGTETHRPHSFARSWAFVATCTGSTRLGREVGLPLAYIDVASDPLARMREMSETRHGALVPTSFNGPFAVEPGWDDWALIHLMPEMTGGIWSGSAVLLQDGAMALTTDRRVPLAEVRLALADALRHLRFHEVACSGDAVRARHAAGGSPVVAPRYTSLRAFGSATGRRVDDLYAFDVWKSLSALAISLEAAVLRARMQIVAEL